MVNGGTAGSLAGAALGISYVGLSLGVAGNVIGSTNRQLNTMSKRKKKRGVRYSGIY